MQTITSPVNNPLSEDDARLAGESGLALLHLIGKGEYPFQKSTLRVHVEQSDGINTELALPSVTLPLLSTILRELSQGKHILVLATDTEVTTQQGADFLQVSRPYLVKLLETGKIPFRRIGPRRRVLLGDLLRYKEQEEVERHQGLDELVAESQKLGLY